MEENKNNSAKTTYMCLSDAEGTDFEVDLVTFREKGQQTKFLSISFVNSKLNPPAVLTAKSFDEESFNQIKKFFAQLEWNE